VGGLYLGCVQKLKKTWEELPKTHQALLKSLMPFVDTSQNSRNYRNEFKRVKDAGEVVLPHIGIIEAVALTNYMEAIYLKDLTFIEDGNKNFLPNDMVNFEKMSMLSKVFSEVAELQKKSYHFIAVPQIRDWLLRVNVTKDDKQLYTLAAQCEVPKQTKLATVTKSKSMHEGLLSSLLERKESPKKHDSGEGPGQKESPEKDLDMKSSSRLLTLRKKKASVKRSVKIGRLCLNFN
jgi:hypothetical protein